MLKWLDMPPVWLAGALLLAWAQARWAGFGLGFGSVWADLLAGLLLGGAVVVFAMAAVGFRRHRTTIVPREEARALITGGIYRFSRNPIYLADTMILAGLILYWDAVLALPLVPIFVWVIERRFILGEEDHLRRRFRTDYARYERRTRRWL